VAAPRAEGVAAASSYDRILLMPGAAPALPLAGASSPPAQNNMAGRGRASNPPAYDAMADEDMENMRQALGPGRDESRADPYRQVSQGQFVMPGIAQPSAGPSAQAPVSQSSGPYGSAQISPAPFTSGSSGGRGPASIGAATPGVFTAQPQTRPMEVRQTPYSNDGPPALPAPVASSSPVPGQVVGQPPATSGAQPSAGPSGGNAPAAPFPFQNPYGLPDAIRAPVVNPNANPYGLPAPVKVTPPPATPPAPIKKSGTDGGQG
jgi:hypothetical protein